jgi:hypothetical protein
VRGGAIPLLAWGALLAVLMTLNWIWTGDAIQVATFALAVVAVYTGAALLAATGRDALRRGPPAPTPGPEALPEASVAAVLVGLSIACILFGLVWSEFLIYFGAGVLVLSLGRVALELRTERESVRRLRGEREP